MTQIYAQTYLNISYYSGDPNSTAFSSIEKVTFTSNEISFHLTDNSTSAKALSSISKISFSQTNGGNPLPVVLSNFIASISGDAVILQWITHTEVNNAGFEIERKEAESNWETIGYEEGHGNSNSRKEYTFTDCPKKNVKLSYRLKQVDLDGSYEYSSVIETILEITYNFELKQNYPNPFNPRTKISYSLAQEGWISLIIFDMLGQKIKTLVDEKKSSGNYEVLFDGNNLPSGIYICRMNCGDYTNSIKMIIMK